MIERIDARGLRCPWPAIRLARALRDGAMIVDIMADDPAAAEEFSRLAEAQGAGITLISDQSGQVFRITAGPSVNVSFTRNG